MSRVNPLVDPKAVAALRAIFGFGEALRALPRPAPKKSKRGRAERAARKR